jgi:hypothetical protein
MVANNLHLKEKHLPKQEIPVGHGPPWPLATQSWGGHGPCGPPISGAPTWHTVQPVGGLLVARCAWPLHCMPRLAVGYARAA